MATSVREWIGAVGTNTAYTERGPSREKMCCESFNAKVREDLRNCGTLYIPAQARIVTEGGVSTSTSSARTLPWAISRRLRYS